MRLSKIEKQPFIFGRYDVVTPVMRFRFMPNISSKNGERVAMIAIAGDHLPTCVAAREKDCKCQSDSAPPMNTRQRSSYSHRPMCGLALFNTSRRTARRAVSTGSARRELSGEQQTERRNHRENSGKALLWAQRHAEQPTSTPA